MNQLGTLNNNSRVKEILDNVSPYNPSDDIRGLTLLIQDDYNKGLENQMYSFKEFGGKTAIQLQEELRKNFLILKDDGPISEDEMWREFKKRPITRNKIIATAANILAGLLYPKYMAQNEDDESDEGVSRIITDITEWLFWKAKYEDKMLYVITTMLWSPLVTVDVNYIKQYIQGRDVLDPTKIVEALDELASGLAMSSIPLDEMLFATLWTRDIQQQRFVIRNRRIQYSEALAKYGKHEYFKYVLPGHTCRFDIVNNVWRNDALASDDNAVTEFTYYSRSLDLEVTFVGGIYMGEMDINNNLFKHRRIVKGLEGKYASIPVYKFSLIRGEPVDEGNCIYGFPMALKLKDDQETVDKMYSLSLDSAKLETFSPIAVVGAGEINQGMIYPGAIASLPNGASINTIKTSTNTVAALNAVQAIERDMENSSISDSKSGGLSTSRNTAVEIQTAEKNAEIMLGIMGVMIRGFVQDFGLLTLDIVLQHYTTIDLDQTTSDFQRVKYRTFIIPAGQTGRSKTHEVRVSGELVGKRYTAKEKRNMSLKLLEESDKGNKTIAVLNPELCANFTYSCIVSSEESRRRSTMLEKANAWETYDRLISNPYIDGKGLTESTLDTVQPNKKEQIMKKDDSQDMINPNVVPQIQPGQGAQPPQVSGAMASLNPFNNRRKLLADAMGSTGQ